MKQLVKLENFTDVSKRDLIEYAKDIADNLDPTDALTVYTAAKKLSDLADTIRLMSKPKAIEGYVSYMGVNKGDLATGNTKISLSSGYDQLDYRQDMKYQALQDALKHRKKQLDIAKERYDKHGLDTTDQETGEIIPVVKVKGFTDDKLNVSY